MSKETCCKNCIHSQWHLTPTGRIRDASGKCVAPLPPFPPLPVSVTKAYGFCGEWKVNCVWPQYGSDCPLFSVNTGKPNPIQ
jgi:hypothetical protein